MERISIFCIAEPHVVGEDSDKTKNTPIFFWLYIAEK